MKTPMRINHSWRAMLPMLLVSAAGIPVAAHGFAFGSPDGIRGYFDTTVGAKAEADSYRHIAAHLELPPEEIVFISDVIAELDAAHAAGLQGLLSVRPGNRPQPPSDLFKAIRTFTELV